MLIAKKPRVYRAVAVRGSWISQWWNVRGERRMRYHATWLEALTHALRMTREVTRA